MILSTAERVSDEVLLIESLLACDLEEQDRERNMSIRNNECFIDK